MISLTSIIDKIYCGNALEILKSFPNNFIQCCVTSPPYYGLRDYGTGSWIGGDPNCKHSFGGQVSQTSTGQSLITYEYGIKPGVDTSHCRICGAIHVDDQIGLEKTPDQYVQNLVEIFQEVKRVLREDGILWLNLGDSYNGSGGPGSQYDRKNETPKGEFTKFENPNKNIEGLKPKDLIGIPWMVAFALRNDGFYLRSDVIWNKPNGMPASTKDRPTRNHEYIFLLTKNKNYYYDQDAIREPYTAPMNRWGGEKLVADGQSTWDEGTGQKTYRDRNMRPNPLGKNRRSVWTINTKSYKGAHFATFPTEIPEICIKAGSKEGDIILDPFNGAGTTCLVAKNLNRQYIGIDLNPKYCEIAIERIIKN
jgi:DNA modification methylase